MAKIESCLCLNILRPVVDPAICSYLSSFLLVQWNSQVLMGHMAYPLETIIPKLSGGNMGKFRKKSVSRTDVSNFYVTFL